MGIKLSDNWSGGIGKRQCALQQDEVGLEKRGLGSECCVTAEVLWQCQESLKGNSNSSMSGSGERDFLHPSATSLTQRTLLDQEASELVSQLQERAWKLFHGNVLSPQMPCSLPEALCSWLGSGFKSGINFKRIIVIICRNAGWKETLWVVPSLPLPPRA